MVSACHEPRSTRARSGAGRVGHRGHEGVGGGHEAKQGEGDLTHGGWLLRMDCRVCVDVGLGSEGVVRPIRRGRVLAWVLLRWRLLLLLLH